MTAATAPTHLHALAIAPDDIDFMGHVNNSVYLEVGAGGGDRLLAARGAGRGGGAASVGRAQARDHLSPPRLPRRHVVASVVAEGVQGARAFFSR